MGHKVDLHSWNSPFLGMFVFHVSLNPQISKCVMKVSASGKQLTWNITATRSNKQGGPTLYVRQAHMAEPSSGLNRTVPQPLPLHVGLQWLKQQTRKLPNVSWKHWLQANDWHEKSYNAFSQTQWTYPVVETSINGSKILKQFELDSLGMRQRALNVCLQHLKQQTRKFPTVSQPRKPQNTKARG